MGLSLESYKVLAEICLANKPEIFETLIGTKASSVIEAVERLDAKTNTVTSGNLGVVLKYLTTLGLTEEQVEVIRGKISRLSMNFDPHDVAYEYTRLEPIKSNLISHLLYKFSESSKVSVNVLREHQDDLWEDFSNFVRIKTKSRFDSDTDVRAFLKHVINNFYKRTSDELKKKITSRGIHQQIDSTNTDLTYLMAEEVSDRKDLEKFAEIHSQLFRMSDFLYTHNNIVYYDVFSREKFKVVTAKVNRCNEIIRKALKNYPAFKFEAIDVNICAVKDNINQLKIDLDFKNPNSTVKKKFTHRESLMLILDEILERDMESEDWHRIVNQAISYDSSKNTKDKVQVFNLEGVHGENKVRMSLEDMLETVILGMSALKRLMDHIRSVDGMNILDVPSDVFKNRKLVGQFNTLNKYIQIIDVTRKLRSEAASESTMINNDHVVNNLLSNNVELDTVPMSRIRQVVQSQRYVTLNEQRKVTVEEKLLLEQNKLDSVVKIHSNFANKVPPDGSLPDKQFLDSVKTYVLSLYLSETYAQIEGIDMQPEGRSYIQNDSGLYVRTKEDYLISSLNGADKEHNLVRQVFSLDKLRDGLDFNLSVMRRVLLFAYIVRLLYSIRNMISFTPEEYLTARRAAISANNDSDRELEWDRFRFRGVGFLDHGFLRDFRHPLPNTVGNYPIIPVKTTKAVGLMHACVNYHKYSFPLNTRDFSVIQNILGPGGNYVIGVNEPKHAVDMDYLDAYNSIIEVFDVFIGEYDRMWEIIEGSYGGLFTISEVFDEECLREILMSLPLFIEVPEEFNLRRSQYTVDHRTGLLMQSNGKYCTRMIEGNKAYLHTKGLWIVPNRYVKQQVYYWRP